MDTLEQPIIANCYQLLKNVLQDAFGVQTVLLKPPYTEFEKIDMGMRALVWTDYDIDNFDMFISDKLPKYRILIVKSNLGFYNIMVTFQGTRQPEFISVGPFRDNELSANYFTRILKDSHIAPADIQNIKHLYERMPLAQVDTVLNVARHIIENFIPEFAEVVPEMIHFAGQEKQANINAELLNAYSAEYAVKYKDMLFQFLHYISRGDNRRAKESLHMLSKESMLFKHKNMKEYKAILQFLNNYCHLALLHTSVHPLYILKQTESIKLKIEEETSFARLEQMMNEICHKYCLLVKNYANQECSRLTKEVMEYIQLHLEEELSLSYLAEHFNKNASVLSNTFSKDKGISITAYIQQTRVQAALKLFNTTKLTVSEVATLVGYQDFSYFSKVFSKHTGCSPRAYKATN